MMTMTTTMTRTEALLKLLAVEPASRDTLLRVTGWPAEETRAVLEQLLRERRVAYRLGVWAGYGVRLYYPAPPKPAPRVAAAPAPRCPAGPWGQLLTEAA